MDTALSRRATGAFILLAAAVTAAAWLPYLHEPLAPDEAGFLLLAQHWSPGSSLYGDYWVDRPPLLLGEFWLAGHLAPTGHTIAGLTAPGVKLLGALSGGASVLLAGLLGSLVAPSSRWPRVAATVVAAALLSSPLFGLPETDGEVLAVPFVLLGVSCLVLALRETAGCQGLALAAVAGGAASCAALIKQNEVDVFVFALAVLLVARSRQVPGLVRLTAGFVVGSLLALGAALAAAATRGTSPVELWDAVVVFRFQASAVIGSSASAATSERLGRLGGAFLGSGAAVLLVVTVAVLLGTRLAHRHHWLTWPTLAVAAWELLGVAAGGSYWLHYLAGMVPGFVLLVAVAANGRGRRLLAAVMGYVVVASLAVWLHHAALPVTVSPDADVASYLRAQAAPSDGVVVAFGHPNIVAASGLSSPYPDLWSLPVRVRDPQLSRLERVMAGPRAPRWMVVAGASLDTWGLSAQSAQDYLERHYVEQVTYGDWHVWRREGGRRP